MIGKIDEIEELYFGGKFDSIFIAIGYKHPRFKSILIDRFRPLIPMANIISPNTYIDSTVKIGV